MLNYFVVTGSGLNSYYNCNVCIQLDKERIFVRKKMSFMHTKTQFQKKSAIPCGCNSTPTGSYTTETLPVYATGAEVSISGKSIFYIFKRKQLSVNVKVFEQSANVYANQLIKFYILALQMISKNLEMNLILYTKIFNTKI